jgi:phenylacetate-CoA ligase
MMSQGVPLDRDGVVLTVIAPCLNEQDNIDLLAERTTTVFDRLGIAAELVLIDDGSTDRTWEGIAYWSKRDERVRGVRHEANRGMEGAWRTGYGAAAGELVCLIDADLQNPPEEIPKLYKAYLRELPDLVQGVRHAVHGLRRNRLFSRGLNVLLNTIFRMRLRDNKSGFLLCRRDVLGQLLHHRYHYRYFQSFVGVAAGARGYTIAEVDTRFDHRHAGRSFLNRFPLIVSARILWELLKFRTETWKASAPARVRSKFPKPVPWPVTTIFGKAASGKA